MNLYFYWHYTIYDIYKKIFKYDDHFDFAATGLFSAIIGLFSYTLIILNTELFNFFLLEKMITEPKYIIPVTGVLFYLFNLFLFRRNKQAEQYSNYKKHFKKWKSIFFLILSVFVFILFGFVVSI